MQIINITNKEQLNDFVASQSMSQFLQSWEWGEFQEKVAGKIFRLGVLDDKNLVAVATIVKKSLPIGKSYFLCPRGPVVEVRSQKLSAEGGSPPAIPPRRDWRAGASGGEVRSVLEFLFNDIEKLTQEEKAMFLRFEPTSDFRMSPRPELGTKTNVELRIKKTLDVQPSKTLVLDLTKPEDELLGKMHPKTRYNIKLAEKHGVKIIESGVSRFEEFWQLLDKTSERDKFRTHGRNYYQAMLETDDNFIKLFFAEYNNRLVASGIFSFFGDTATYLHGGSANEFRNVMAPYLLHWHCIKLAREKGFKYYDFNGVDEVKWPGVTKFKNGFGGFKINYPGTFDLIFDNSWYNIYKMVRKVRRTF